MNEGFAWYPYTLRVAQPLNAKTTRLSYKGALVRDQQGYGCIHPWPELGDGTLIDELNALACRNDTPLTCATRRCLSIDRQARQDGVSLFRNSPPLESHATLNAYNISASEQLGFRTVKVKGLPDRLDALAQLLESSEMPVRIDFNESMTLEALLKWNRILPESAQRKIDFIEDPCPYNPTTWEKLANETGWNLAVDRRATEADGGFQILVVKPAVDDIEMMERRLTETGKPFLVTSYMDHPIGQLFAAYQAGELVAKFPDQALPLHGLATQHLFEETNFALGEGPHFDYPSGTGLGFDSTLESLPWQPWNR